MAHTLATRGTVFAEDAEKAGWEVSLEAGENGRETVTATYAESGLEIRMVWDSGRYNYPESYQLRDGEKKTVRNAAEARRVLCGATGAKLETKKVVRRQVRPTRDWEAEARHIRPPAKRLPFKISQPDRDILASVLGKEIRWWNGKARRVESSRVMASPNQRHLKIVEAKGKRILCWAGIIEERPGRPPIAEGFRSVYIENILEVSG